VLITAAVAHPRMGRECPYCGANAEIASKNGPFTIWECDGEPGDVWTQIDEDELHELVANSDEEVRWELVEDADGGLNLERLLGEQ